MPAMDTARVALVSGDLLLGSRLRAALAGSAAVVVAQAGDVPDADVVFVDLNQNVEARLALISELHARAGTRVIGFCQHDERAVRIRAMESGADQVVTNGALQQAALRVLGCPALPDSQARVAAEIDRVAEEVVATRRGLHRQPELSLQEHRTAELAARRCEELGFAVRTGVGGTGVIADLDGAGAGGPEGRTLMLRADMDALPILERGSGRVATSEVEGVMHACGHDGHVAMTLGAAAALSSLRDSWHGRLRLCFQPAEEIAAGAVPMIDDGAVEGVDQVLGIHLWAPLQVGLVGVKDGPIFGSADEFAVTVRGRGGHGGMPHTSIDPVVAASHVVLALQSLVSRETSPFAPAVVTIGRISGGSAFNVIADEVQLRGTVRAVDAADRERLLRRVGEVASAIASASGASADFERLKGCPPVISDLDSVALVRRAAAATVGEGNVVTPQPITVGDDVACLINEAGSGCYFLVGAGDVAAHPVAPHHSADFDIDERALPVGVGTLVRAALEVLG
jgi:amidohydrolase